MPKPTTSSGGDHGGRRPHLQMIRHTPSHPSNLLNDSGTPTSVASSVGTLGQSRRRQLGFMKYGVVERKHRNPTQSREHARQLALASFDNATSSSQSFEHSTPLQNRLRQRQLQVSEKVTAPTISAAFAADFGSAFGDGSSSPAPSSNGSNSDDDDNFFAIKKHNSTINPRTFDGWQPPQQGQTQNGLRLNVNNSNFFDQKNISESSTPVFVAPVVRSIQEERNRRLTDQRLNSVTTPPIAKTTSGSITHSGSNAMTEKRSNYSSKNNSGFHETASDFSEPVFISTVSSEKMFPAKKWHEHQIPTASKNPSFMTFPSNSSMQSEFAHQQASVSLPRQQPASGLNGTKAPDSDLDNLFPAVASEFLSPALSSSTSSSAGSGVGAAARRRMKQHMKKQSSWSQQVEPAQNPQLQQTQQSSTRRPGSASGSDTSSVVSSSRGGSEGGKLPDHAANYHCSNSNANNSSQNQQSQVLDTSGYSSSTTATNRSIGRNQAVNNTAGNNASFANRSVSSALSDSGGASTTSSTANEVKNLFDPTNSHGFTFDAFGLDANVMNQQVDQAMKDLTGVSHPDISMFLDLDPADAWKWDDATPSRASTPVLQVGNNTPSTSADFVDGFRVTKNPVNSSIPTLLVKQSPTRSEKSSLTNDSYNHQQAGTSSQSDVNPFKVQAGFDKASKTQRKVVRPGEVEKQFPNSSTQQPQFEKEEDSTAESSLSSMPQPHQQRQAHTNEKPLPSRGSSNAEIPVPKNQHQTSSKNENNFVAFAGVTNDHNVGIRSRSFVPKSDPTGALFDTGTNRSFQYASEYAVNSNVVSDQVRTAVPDNIIKSTNYRAAIEVQQGQDDVPDSNHARRGVNVSFRSIEESHGTKTDAKMGTVTQDDEKKDDDDFRRERNQQLHSGQFKVEAPQPNNHYLVDASVNNLRSQWENKVTGANSEATDGRINVKESPKPLSREEIDNLQSQLGSELWSPEKIDRFVSSSATVQPQHLQQNVLYQQEYEDHHKTEQLSKRMEAETQRRPIQSQQLLDRQTSVQRELNDQRDSYLHHHPRANSRNNLQQPMLRDNLIDSGGNQGADLSRFGRHKVKQSGGKIESTHRYPSTQNDSTQTTQSQTRSVWHDETKTPQSDVRPSVLRVKPSEAEDLRSKSEGGADVRYNNINTILKSLTPSPRDTGSDTGVYDVASSNLIGTSLFDVKLRKTAVGESFLESNEIQGNIQDFMDSKLQTSKRTPSKHAFASQAARMVMREQGQNDLGKKNHMQQQQQQPFVAASSSHSSQQAPQKLQYPKSSSLSKVDAPGSTVSNFRQDYRAQSDGSHQNLESRTLETNATSQDVIPEPNRQGVLASIEKAQSKQLTYRERRELEIQKQRESQIIPVQPSSTPDVASLIKRRIAANKNRQPIEHSTVINESSESVSSYRSKLKPVTRQEAQVYQEAQTRADGTDKQANSVTTGSHNHQNIDYDNAKINLPNQSSSYASYDDNITIPRSHLNDEEEERVDSHLDRESGNMNLASRRDNSINQENPRRGPTNPSRLTDLVIEEGHFEEADSETKSQSATISHLLLLQHMQQMRQEEDSPEKSSLHLNEKRKAPRNLTILAPDHDEKLAIKASTPKATMMMLNAFLAGRESLSSTDGGKSKSNEAQEQDVAENSNSSLPSSSLPALKDDPEYTKYFKMLSIGMPLDVVKHAMARDGFNPSVMDGDHNKPAGIPLKDDPDYAKYFRMLSIGLPMEAVKHSMARDGLDPAVMDQDHNLPATSLRKKEDKPKEADSHRRARLHWKTLRKVASNSLWAQIDKDIELENLDIDEKEFQELFQEEKSLLPRSATKNSVQKRSSTVCVIDSKRANNGGIILARLRMSHDDLADAVDRIDERPLSAEQIENIIEYLPTKDERRALEAYMLEGGQDAAEKFECLCECEKFMVSMMTVKHAKRKVSALLFKLQFETCLQDIQKEADLIENACTELNHSVRLRQLLGIILTFGNRLNTAGNKKHKAGAFTLDSLLKLNQAKAFDKKTTFLHYIVLIVRRNNETLLNFRDDIPSVFAAEKVFWDQCVTDLDEVENQLENLRKIALYQAHQNQSYRLRLKKKPTHPQDQDGESLSDDEMVLSLEEEVEALRSTPIGLFTLNVIRLVSNLREKVENTNRMFNRLLEYFGEEDNRKQPHELFGIIVSFSREFEKAKDEVISNEKKKLQEDRKRNNQSNKTPNGKYAQGRPPAYSPMLKASNLQPNLSHILNEVKRNFTAPHKENPAHISIQLPTNYGRVVNEGHENEAGAGEIKAVGQNHMLSPNEQEWHGQHIGQHTTYLERIREEDVDQHHSPVSSVTDVHHRFHERRGFRLSPEDAQQVSHSVDASPSLREKIYGHNEPDTAYGTEESQKGEANVERSPEQYQQFAESVGDTSDSYTGSESAQQSGTSMSAMRSKARLRRQRYGGTGPSHRSLFQSTSVSSPEAATVQSSPVSDSGAASSPHMPHGQNIDSSSSYARGSSTNGHGGIYSPNRILRVPQRMSSPSNKSAGPTTPSSCESNASSCDNQNSLTAGREAIVQSTSVFSSAASRAAIRHKRRLLEQQQRAKTSTQHNHNL